MDDLISRQAAIEAIQNHFNPQNEEMPPEIAAVLAGVGVVLGRLPSADVVEVVRCVDCKYSSPNGVYGCRLERYNFNDESVRMYGEDYCSYGERITDG